MTLRKANQLFGSHNRSVINKAIDRIESISTTEGEIDADKVTADEVDATLVEADEIDADSIETDAILYTDTYWDDLRTPSNQSKKVPGKEAKDQAYRGGVVIKFEDGADQAISFNVQLPHAYKTGSDIEFHAHIVLPTAGAGGGAENVKFDFTHSWANINSAFPSETAVSATFDVQDYTVDTHKLIEIAETIDGSAITDVSSMIICSLTRDVSVSDNYTDDVYMTEVDFHYQIDAPGSADEYVK